GTRVFAGHGLCNGEGVGRKGAFSRGGQFVNRCISDTRFWILPQKSHFATELSCSPGAPQPMKIGFTRQPYDTGARRDAAPALALLVRMSSAARQALASRV